MTSPAHSDDRAELVDLIGDGWDTSGARVASLLSFSKTKLTGETHDAEHGTAVR